jgi:hypothetical protein
MSAKISVGAALLCALAVVARAEETRIALAIVYDTSGSMKESVRDGSGKPAPKYVVANRALDAVVNRLQSLSSETISRRRKGLACRPVRLRRQWRKRSREIRAF